MKIEDLEKALQYFVIAVPESEEQAKAYFWARKALTALRSMLEAGALVEHKELTAQLRRMSVQTGSLVCLGCGYEHSCGIHGCAVLNAAARALENQKVSARWFDRGSLSSRCSNCGCKSTKESKYCPNCGARMEE